MPSFGWAPFGQSEPGQHAQHGAGFCERELCLHGDLRRGFNALSERDQAGSLRLGENKISIRGHAAAPSVDSFGRSMHYSALSRWGGEPAFHSALRLRPGVPISLIIADPSELREICLVLADTRFLKGVPSEVR